MLEECIRDFYEDVTVQAYLGIESEGRRKKKVFAPDKVVKMSPFPMSEEDIKQSSPGNVFTSEDKKFYREGKAEYKKNSVIIHEGDRYEIKGIFDRNTHGGFTRYKCVRIR